MEFDPKYFKDFGKICQKIAEEQKDPALRRFTDTKQPYCTLLEAEDLKKVLAGGENIQNICPYMSTTIIDIDRDTGPRLNEEGAVEFITSSEHHGCNWPTIFKRDGNDGEKDER